MFGFDIGALNMITQATDDDKNKVMSMVDGLIALPGKIDLLITEQKRTQEKLDSLLKELGHDAGKSGTE